VKTGQTVQLNIEQRETKMRLMNYDGRGKMNLKFKILQYICKLINLFIVLNNLDKPFEFISASLINIEKNLEHRGIDYYLFLINYHYHCLESRVANLLLLFPEFAKTTNRFSIIIIISENFSQPFFLLIHSKLKKLINL
jgi:hypothetical protein